MPVDVYVWEIGQFIDDKTRGFTGLLVYIIILLYIVGGKRYDWKRIYKDIRL